MFMGRNWGSGKEEEWSPGREGKRSYFSHLYKYQEKTNVML
jgi:hypothetical protein